MARLQAGSKSQRSLSGLILRDPVFVATQRIEDVSGMSGILASTISRYVRDLGIDSYAAFRAGVADRVHALIAPVTKLENRPAEVAGTPSPVDASLATALAHLEALSDPDTSTALWQASDLLGRARHVWVMGFGLSAHLAAILALGLEPYRDRS